MARSGETSSTGDKGAHGNATMRGGARRYFKIPPVIDHQAGSFLADRLRLLGGVINAAALAALFAGSIIFARGCCHRDYF